MLCKRHGLIDGGKMWFIHSRGVDQKAVVMMASVPNSFEALKMIGSLNMLRTNS